MHPHCAMKKRLGLFSICFALLVTAAHAGEGNVDGYTNSLGGYTSVLEVKFSLQFTEAKGDIEDDFNEGRIVAKDEPIGPRKFSLTSKSILQEREGYPKSAPVYLVSESAEFTWAEMLIADSIYKPERWINKMKKVCSLDPDVLQRFH